MVNCAGLTKAFKQSWHRLTQKIIAFISFLTELTFDLFESNRWNCIKSPLFNSLILQMLSQIFRAVRIYL